jgi:hypothetical protein
MSRNVAIGMASAAMVLLAAANAHAKACTNGVCAESRDDGRTMNVYLSTTMTGMTHFNVRAPGRSQFEAGKQFSIPVKEGETYRYSVQACRRGGLLQKSMCTQWANFRHEVDEPKGSVSQGLSKRRTYLQRHSQRSGH